MKDLLNKITSYNLFNYLLPGVLFVVALEKFTSYSLIHPDIIIGIFVYYFAGLVVSRFGSLVIEPILKDISFVKSFDGDKLVTLARTDEKINIYTEANNMYRTFIALFVLVLLVRVYELYIPGYPFLSEYGLHILFVLLLIVFLFSYRKQSEQLARKTGKARKSEQKGE
ncbi:MAG: hypothetical protein HYT93_04635 [Parcubacteria group bacterium]|nr:hypothetical protein [Parcubacteria group bacterium]